MAFLSSLDIVFITATLVGLFAHFVRVSLSRLLGSRKRTTNFQVAPPQKQTKTRILPPTRSIKKRLDQAGKDCVIFYGSQTGTAEKLALKLAKEGSTRFNLQSMVADLDDFEYDDLLTLGDEKVAIFLLATYGEGEPTDNAITFDQFIRSKTHQEDDKNDTKSLFKLHYAAFGLGNTSYQHYNSMIRRVDSALLKSGASRLGELGLGDDGKGTLEDDFIAWKDSMLAVLAKHLNLVERDYVFEATFQVEESSASHTPDVFLGEVNKFQLKNKLQGPFTAQNPLPARIVESRELFAAGSRNCLHVEFDITGSTMTYETGDHLAVWPVNSDVEVHRFLRLFGLYEKKDVVIDITSRELTLKVPIPSKTTYAAAVRYYLDICAPVSRQFLAVLVSLADDEVSWAELTRLSSDRTAFQQEVKAQCLNLAQVLTKINLNKTWSSIPLSLLLENVSKLQPRYYSISSSSLVSKTRISITAVVESKKYSDSSFEFKGVATNYLLALKSNFALPCDHTLTASTAPPLVPPTHEVYGPRNKFTQPTALIHVRRSKFRLPKNSSIPIIMIGPGTGVAPFRGFVQERALQGKLGRGVGRTMLFYGCRRSDEDFLYQEEWQDYAKSFPSGAFSLYTAFSRAEEGPKVYVQDLLHQHAAELRELVVERNAHFYVCGDASRMARDVFKAMAQIVTAGEKVGDAIEDGTSFLSGLKASGRWCEDVW